MFSNLQHKFFVAETKKKSNQFEFFFLVSATKNFRKKVAKQRNLTWGQDMLKHLLAIATYFVFCCHRLKIVSVSP